MITFKNILREIGINDPHKLKAYESNELLGTILIKDYGEDTDILCFDGNTPISAHCIPGYYYTYDQYEGDSNILKKWFKKYQDGNRILLIIPKSQIQIVGKLDEIGVNIPNKIRAVLYPKEILSVWESENVIQIDNEFYFHYDEKNKIYYEWFDEFNVKRLKKSQYFPLMKLEKEKHTYGSDEYLYVIPEQNVEIIKTIEI